MTMLRRLSRRDIARTLTRPSFMRQTIRRGSARLCCRPHVRTTAGDRERRLRPVIARVLLPAAAALYVAWRRDGGSPRVWQDTTNDEMAIRRCLNLDECSFSGLTSSCRCSSTLRAICTCARCSSGRVWTGRHLQVHRRRQCALRGHHARIAERLAGGRRSSLPPSWLSLRWEGTRHVTFFTTRLRCRFSERCF